MDTGVKERILEITAVSLTALVVGFLIATEETRKSRVSRCRICGAQRYELRWFFGMGVPFLGALAMFYARGRRPVPRWVRVMQGLVATSMGYVLLVGADFFSFHRYLVPSFAPMLLVTWWYGVDALVRWRERHPANPKSRLAKIAFAVLAFTILQVVYFVGRVPPQGLVHGFIVYNTMDWALVAGKLREKTPPDTAIATIPIGAMGYFSHRYILDLVGLTDTHIAHAQVPTGVAITGHEKYDIDYVMRRNPEMIFSWPGLMPPEPEGLVKWVLSNIGAEAQKKLMLHPETRRRYTFVWMILDQQTPIRRGSFERWQGLKNADWAGDKNAKGVIGLLRSDLVGTPEFAAFTPLPEPQAIWLWETFVAGTYEEMLRRMRDLPPTQPADGA